MPQRKVNIKKFKDASLTTEVSLRFEEGGETVTDTFKLRYLAVSPKRQREIDEFAEEFDREHEEREQRAEAARAARSLAAAEARDLTEKESALVSAVEDDEQGAQYALAEFLVRLGVRLPEIVGDDQEPVELTADELAGWDSANLLAIRNAIRSHANPNAKASSD